MDLRIRNLRNSTNRATVIKQKASTKRQHLQLFLIKLLYALFRIHSQSLPSVNHQYVVKLKRGDCFQSPLFSRPSVSVLLGTENPDRPHQPRRQKLEIGFQFISGLQIVVGREGNPLGFIDKQIAGHTIRPFVRH